MEKEGFWSGAADFLQRMRLPAMALAGMGTYVVLKVLGNATGFFDEQGEIVTHGIFMLAGMLIAGFINMMAEWAKKDPPPTVPASVHERMADRFTQALEMVAQSRPGAIAMPESPAPRS